MREPPRQSGEFIGRCLDAGCTLRQMEVLYWHLMRQATQEEIAALLEITQPSVHDILRAGTIRLARHGREHKAGPVPDALIKHLLEQDIEEVYISGADDAAHEESDWRKATLRK